MRSHGPGLRRLRLLTGAVIVLGATAAAAAACDNAGLPVTKVFEGAPWTGPETYTYRVTDRGVKGAGECRLTTTIDSGAGHSRLERNCQKDVYRDDAVVEVDAKTLAPFTSSRTYVDGKKNQSVTHTVVYNAETASFKTDDGSKQRETVRDLPRPTGGGAEPGWYDDDELLWLARGIRLATGYESAYSHVINAGQPRILTVRVKVEGAERVSVPAGEFEAWKVRFDREQSVYFVWVEVAAPHRVLRARIEDTVYELTTSR